MRRWFSSSSAMTLSGISSAIRAPPISKLPKCIETKMRPRPWSRAARKYDQERGSTVTSRAKSALSRRGNRMISTRYLAKLRKERRATRATSRSPAGSASTTAKFCFATRRRPTQKRYASSPPTTAAGYVIHEGRRCASDAPTRQPQNADPWSRRSSISRSSPAERLLTGTALDVFLHALARPVVRDLARRRLHEVRRRRHDRAAEAPVERELAAAYCVDDDSGAVRRVPDLELYLRVQRYVAEG